MGTLNFIRNSSTYTVAPCTVNTVISSPLLHVRTVSSNSPDDYGFTTNTSASQYSPSFRVGGSVCYLGRTESHTSSRSSQYTSGYATRSSISGYGTASRVSTSGYATRSSISGYGTATRKSTSATSYAAQYGQGESDMFCDFNRGGLNKISVYGGGVYTRTALMAEKVNEARITVSFSNTKASPWTAVSKSTLINNAVSSMSTSFGNGDTDYFYMSVMPGHSFFCDIDGYNGFKVTAEATKYLSDVYLTRSSQYTTATLTRASTSATLTRSSQYTTATLTRASTSATLTASKSSQYNTTSCNINM